MVKYLIEETTLTEIGNAIRGKEGSTDLIPVVDMASRISEIASGSGKKFTSGTVTFTTSLTQQIVTHNLGSIPSCVMLYPKDLSIIPESGTEETKGKAYKHCRVYSLIGNINKGISFQGNTSTGVLVWNIESNTIGYVNETTFCTGATSKNYKFPANIEFEWIAIE